MIVEDGTGLADADSYAATAETDTYLAGLGNTAWGLLGAAEKEAALVRATAWLDGKYGASFSGTRTNGRSQGLQWPRDNATDVEGNSVTGVPIEVKRATMFAASREGATSGSLTPDNSGPTVKRERLDVLEREYFSGTQDNNGISVSEVDNILSALLSANALSSGTTVTPLLRY